jgi:adenylate kinase family enzyme
MKLVIIRGPSGSGKSTIAQHLGGIRGVNWLEADMFFRGPDGSYNFDPRKLGQAHAWCQAMTRKAIEHNQEILTKDQYWKNLHLANPKPEKIRDVIVSNTSTTIAEANAYIEIAKAFAVPFEIIRTPSPWNIIDLFARNEHNVPQEVLVKQIGRYVAVPGETEWTDLTIFKG